MTAETRKHVQLEIAAEMFARQVPLSPLPRAELLALALNAWRAADAMLTVAENHDADTTEGT